MTRNIDAKAIDHEYEPTYQSQVTKTVADANEEQNQLIDLEIDGTICNDDYRDDDDIGHLPSSYSGRSKSVYGSSQELENLILPFQFGICAVPSERRTTIDIK